MVTENFRAMVVSVGGTPAPIILSLNIVKPEYICFFASEESKKMIDEDILPKLDFRPRHHDWIITPNAELLSNCYGQLIKKLPEILEKWDVDPREVCIDYTGGTKTMSAALVLATVENSCYYSYVGGDERSKGGVGIVLDGKEKMRFLNNPWDEIAIKERKEAAILFNKARYASSAEVLKNCLSKISEKQRPFFEALLAMVQGYDLWDRFQHDKAKTHLYRCRNVLIALSAERENFRAIVDCLEINIRFLEKLLACGKPSRLFFYDLLSNAKRRADLEGKFDDAVARLYRAIEVLAQNELKKNYGIDSSNVDIESVPPSIRQEFSAGYQQSGKGKLKIPLFASYRLLKELGNELAIKFYSVYESEIRPILDIRNSSILAHGFNPVEKSTFMRLLKTILEFSGTKEEEIPSFPVLNI